jgi:PAS domain S-box-containing protein
MDQAANPEDATSAPMPSRTGGIISRLEPVAVTGLVVHAAFASAALEVGTWGIALTGAIVATGVAALYGIVRPGGPIAWVRAGAALLLAGLLGHLSGGVAVSVWTAWLTTFAVFFPLSMETAPAAVAPAAIAGTYFVAATFGVDRLPIVDAAMRSTAFAAAAVASYLTGHVVLGLRSERDRVAGRLSEAEGVIDAAFATSLGGMAVLDLDGRITAVNDALARLLGFEAGSLDGSEWPLLFHPAEVGSIRESLVAISNGERTSFERDARLLRVDGATVFAVVGMSGVLDGSDRVAHIFTHVTNITDRVKSERRLRQSESHYRHLFESSPVPLWEIDLTAVEEMSATFDETAAARLLESSRIRNVNEAARDLFGAADDGEFAAGFASGRLGRDHSNAFGDLVLGLGNGALRGERPVLATDFGGGRHQGLLRILVPTVEGEPDLTGVVIAFVDTTEQAAVEENLVRLEEQLHTVMSGAPIVVFAIDPQGVYTLSEGQALGLTGQNPGDAVGRSVFEVHRDSPGVIRNVRRALTGEEFTGLDEIGDLLFETRYSPVFERGRLSAVLGVSYDITDRVRTAERLRELVRSKDDFVATVSHELRTPLTAVVGFAHELRDGLDLLEPEDVATYVGLIEEQATEVGDLVEDLLVASRAEQGEVPISLGATDLWEQVDAVVAARLHGSEIGTEGRDVPAKVFADAIRVRQILRNLLVNADRYGGPNVRVRVESRDDTRVLEVRDDGDGIPSSHRSFIFEPYQRAHRAEGRTESVGLGLTVSRHLAELMGGTLDYAYTGGESIFSLTLPAA